MKLEIAKIRLDGGTQPRAALNLETIADCSALLRQRFYDPKTPSFLDYD